MRSNLKTTYGLNDGSIFLVLKWPWIAHLNPCQEERIFTTKYKSHSSNTEVQLGYHSDHYQSLSNRLVKSKYTYLNIQCLTFSLIQNGSGMQKVKHFTCVMSLRHYTKRSTANGMSNSITPTQLPKDQRHGSQIWGTCIKRLFCPPPTPPPPL